MAEQAPNKVQTQAKKEKMHSAPQLTDNERFHNWALSKVPIQPLPRSTKQISLEKFIHLLNTSKGRPTKNSVVVKYNRELALVRKHALLLLQHDKRYAAYQRAMERSTEINRQKISLIEEAVRVEDDASDMESHDFGTSMEQCASMSHSMPLTDDYTESEAELGQVSDEATTQQSEEGTNKVSESISDLLNVSKNVEKTLEKTLATLAKYMALELDSKLLEQELMALTAESDLMTRLLQRLQECHIVK